MDPLGQIVAELPVFSLGAATWEPPARLMPRTLYTRLGDWILLPMLMAMLAGLFLSAVPFLPGRSRLRTSAALPNAKSSEEP